MTRCYTRLPAAPMSAALTPAALKSAAFTPAVLPPTALTLTALKRAALAFFALVALVAALVLPPPAVADVPSLQIPNWMSVEDDQYVSAGQQLGTFLSLDATEVVAMVETRTGLDIKPLIHPDAPLCMQCGDRMMRAGSCFACPSCGTTSGCS